MSSLPRKISHLFFVGELVVFVLVAFGIIPRTATLYLTGAFLAYMLWAPLTEGVRLFVISIPLFMALPLTQTFDNFNAWRIILLVLFAKWFLEQGAYRTLFSALRSPIRYLREHRMIAGLLLLLFFAFLSLVSAPDRSAGIKRIIYFANFTFLGFIIYDLVRTDRNYARELIAALRIPAYLVIAVGFLQVVSTYLMDIYQFMRLWGEGIQCNQFGQQWCYIAVHVGNTWFAYFGKQLSLRVFSLFPDSHSFPQFVLLTVPSLLALGVSNILRTPEHFERLKSLIRTRGRLVVLWVPAAFLMAILSGTRGIWAASLGVVLVILGLNYLLIRNKADHPHKTLFRYAGLYLALFFLLFSVAYPVFTSPQFLVSKGDFGLFRNRIKSIIDFGETSNSQRLEIWKKSLISIKEHPLMGVGIGNFPVVLAQVIKLSRAGSSAHNIYLHIAAEMGVLALVVTLMMLWGFFRRSYRAFLATHDPFMILYLAGALIFIPWVLIYSLTDVALFDERAFLLFTAIISMIFALPNHEPTSRID